jgi:hypothetical protein
VPSKDLTGFCGKTLRAGSLTGDEAQIFYASALVVAADPGDKTYTDQLEAGAILEKLFVEEPTHPGLAHYIIHAYDVPALAGRALLAAQRYAEIAPDAPHALHMPSHTFTRLGYWQESIDSNVAAAAAARRQGQTAEELHASDYGVYAYLQTGQDEAAARIVKSLPEMASRFDPSAVLIGAGPPAAGYFALAAIPARYALERHDWQQAAALAQSETPFPYADAMTWFARGVGAARLGHPAAATEAATALRQIQQHLSKTSEVYWAQQVEIQATAVSAWSALAAGRNKEALRQMKLAEKLEDLTEKSVVTPGPLSPARELLGEVLVEMNNPAKALVQFEETLKKEPRRFRSLYGAAHAAQLSGRSDLGQKYFGELLTVCALSDKPGRPEIREAREALAKQKRLTQAAVSRGPRRAWESHNLFSRTAACDSTCESRGNVGMREAMRPPPSARRFPKTFPPDQRLEANLVALRGLALPENGAGDGNRTHGSSLGSLGITIIRRPLERRS